MMTPRKIRQRFARRPLWTMSRLVLVGIPGCVALATALTACAPAADTPMAGPIEAMKASWGPFSRQCARTVVSHDTFRWRVGELEISHTYEACVGFSALPVGNGSTVVTASISGHDASAPPVILRVLRDPGGASRAAGAGDTGLLAQGSDDSAAARRLAGEIGLTARQEIDPGEALSLPVRLEMPFPVDVSLSCRPDGGHRDHGRDTLVLSCGMNREIRTDRLDGRLVLNGVEEIDVRTGVRLESDLTGHLSGQMRADNDGVWRSASDRVEYVRTMEFE